MKKEKDIIKKDEGGLELTALQLPLKWQKKGLKMNKKESERQKKFNKNDWDLNKYDENYKIALEKWRKVQDLPYEKNDWKFKNNPQTEYQKNILKWEEENKKEMELLISSYKNNLKDKDDFF